MTGYNFLTWYLTPRSFHYSLYVRCILSWGHALGPLGGLSTGQLNCCLPRMEEKRSHHEWAFLGGPTTFPNKSKITDGDHIEFRTG